MTLAVLVEKYRKAKPDAKTKQAIVFVYTQMGNTLGLTRQEQKESMGAVSATRTVSRWNNISGQ